MSKRGCSEEQIAETFQNTLGLAPREQQTKALAFLQDNPRAVLELETGAGKSYVAAYQLALEVQKRRLKPGPDAGEVNTCGVYLCYTTDLQAQFVRDAQQWSRTANCTVGCLFGRDQYWCPRKIIHALQTHPGFGKHERALREYVQGLRATGQRLSSQAHSFWYTAQRSEFYEFCVANGIENCEELWSAISAKNCTCTESEKKRILLEQDAYPTDDRLLKSLECPQGYARILVKRADIAVVSMALAFTYLANDLRGIFDNEPLVVIDEAHTLKDASECLLSAQKLPDFNVDEIRSQISEWRSLGVVDVVNGVSARTSEVFRLDLGRGSNQFSRNCEAVSFETSEIKKHLQLITVKPEQAVYTQLLDAVTSMITRLGLIEASVYTASSDGHYLMNGVVAVDEMSSNIRRVAPFASSGYKKAAMEEAVRLLRDELQTDMARDPLTKKVYANINKISRNETPLELHATATRVCRVVRAITAAQTACRQGDWTSDAERKLVVPTAIYKSEQNKYARFTGIEYVPSDGAYAQQLAKHLWNNPKLKDILVMSATLGDEKRCLKPFYTEVGIDLACTEKHAAITSHVGGAAFDKRSIMFYSPPMQPFKSFSPDYNTQCVLACQVVSNNPRSTLVFGPNLGEVRELKRRLMVQLPHIEHIDYNSERTKYTRFVHTQASRAVIYGTTSLSTGVDLPGRLGAVIFTKPYKPKWMQVVRNYTERYLGIQAFRQLEALYEYRTYRSVIQGAGRLQRRESDHGWVVMFHDPVTKSRSYSAKMHKRYPSATYTTNAPRVSM